MRLLNTSTLSLQSFHGKPIPPYAILSHTWGDDEVLFEDIQKCSLDSVLTSRAASAGFRKVVDSCQLAARNGFGYIWIDTCCIDKSSSAELSESINSMFKWYQQAEVCYAFLVDVDSAKEIPGSRWFTRGWTLQELIAPPKLVFFTRNWVEIATRQSLAAEVSEITGIDEAILTKEPHRCEGLGFSSDSEIGARLGFCYAHNLHFDIVNMVQSVSIATRMFWASRRQTTRVEDTAYCLMGIFGINMPLLYGEGKSALRRLQEEIMKHSDDQSILAWHDQDRSRYAVAQHFLSSTPSNFRHRTYGFTNVHKGRGLELDKRGLHLDLQMCRIEQHLHPAHSRFWLGVLHNCGLDAPLPQRPSRPRFVAIILAAGSLGDTDFFRICPEVMVEVLSESEANMFVAEEKGTSSQISIDLSGLAWKHVTILHGQGVTFGPEAGPFGPEMWLSCVGCATHDLMACYGFSRREGNYFHPAVTSASWVEDFDGKGFVFGGLYFGSVASVRGPDFYLLWGIVTKEPVPHEAYGPGLNVCEAGRAAVLLVPRGRTIRSSLIRQEIACKFLSLDVGEETVRRFTSEARERVDDPALGVSAQIRLVKVLDRYTCELEIRTLALELHSSHSQDERQLEDEV